MKVDSIKVSMVSGVLGIVLLIASLLIGTIGLGLGALCTIVALGTFIRWVIKDGGDEAMFFAGAGIIVVAIIAGGAITWGSIEVVSSGDEGVIVSSPLGNNGEQLDEGWHVNPIYLLSKVETIRYNTQTSEYIGGTDSSAIDNDGCIMVLSSDALYVYIDMSISYNLNKDTVGKLRTEFGSDWKMQLIHQNVRSIPRNVALQYKALDLATDDTSRTEFQNKIVAQLTDKIESDSHGYVKVSNVAIREVRFADSLISKINEKMNAQQDQERAVIEQETEKIRADTEKQVAIVQAQKELELAEKQLEIETANMEVAKKKAEAEAAVKKTEAEAEAYAIQKKAEAEAEAYQMLINEFGSVDKYNQYILYQNTTTTIVPSGSTPIIGV